MFTVLLWRELRAHLLTYRFALSACLLLVLVIGSSLVLALNYDRQLAAWSEARMARRQMLAQATDFRSLRWRGIQQEEAPNPLSVFTVGLERELSRSISISYRDPKLGRSKYASALYLLFPPPDLLYIVNIVGSLLAVLFAFNAVTGEHEAGTLRLVMSNAVPRHTVLLAKWLSGYAALTLPLLAAVLLAVLLATATTAFHLWSPQWIALGGMLVVAAVYLSVFFTLALAVSIYARRSSTSLVVNFLIWVVLVLAVPNVAPIIARALVEVPSPGAVAGQREAIRRAAWTHLRASGWRQMSRDERDEARAAMDEDVARQTQRLLDDYARRLQAQIEAGVLLARLSPSSAYVYATAALAGVGLDDYAGLRAYIDRYRRQYIEAVDAIRQQRRAQVQGIHDQQERQDILEAPVDPDDLPAFAPGTRPLGKVLAANGIDLLILVALNGVFFLAAYIGFLRFELVD